MVLYSFQVRGKPSSMEGVICLGVETFTSSELRERNKESIRLNTMLSMVLRLRFHSDFSCSKSILELKKA